MSVCFSEVPLHLLSRIAQRRSSNYGIGFRKEFIVTKGGGPIWYAYNGSKHAAAISGAVEVAARDPDHPIWQIAPFVDLPGVYGDTSYFFEWEREWRLCGNLSFVESDAAFLVIPEAEHQAAKEFFEEHGKNNTGPNYRCPFIDASWDRARVSSVIPF